MTGPYLHLRLLLFALLLAGCEMPVALDEPVDIRVIGRVTDAETGVPLDSTRVSIRSGFIIVDEEAHASTVTSTDGRYDLNVRFVSECPGDLRVTAFDAPGSGFDFDSESLECEDGTLSVDLVLMRPEEGADGASSQTE